jgi:hypothetical protein
MEGTLGYPVKWTTEVRGSMGHALLPDLERRRLLVADGWGVAFASLGVRALALPDGRELAHVRLKTPARKLAELDGGRILVLSDKRLHILDASTLAESKRWDDKIPHYGTSLVAGGGFAHVASSSPSVASVDLSGGAVKRKKHPGSISLHRLDHDSFVVASGDGLVSKARFGLVRPFETIAQAPPFLARDADVRGLWICPGLPQEKERVDVPGGWIERTIADAAPTKIAYLCFSDGAITRELDLGAWVRTIAVSRSGQTVAVVTGERGDVLAMVRARDGAVHWMHAPGPVECVLPDVGLAWTTRPRPGPRDAEGSADLICFEVPSFEDMS